MTLEQLPGPPSPMWFNLLVELFGQLPQIALFAMQLVMFIWVRHMIKYRIDVGAKRIRELETENFRLKCPVDKELTKILCVDRTKQPFMSHTVLGQEMMGLTPGRPRRQKPPPSMDAPCSTISDV
jgi:hypothetical protein